MTFAYSGKILWVNLSNAELREEATEPYLEWIGGRGLGSYLLSKNPALRPPPKNLLLLPPGRWWLQGCRWAAEPPSARAIACPGGFPIPTWAEILAIA